MKDFSEVWPGLQSLSCERLSSNDDNLRLVDDFFNRRNDGIAQTLRNEAFGEDEEGTTAYYVVKRSSEQILFFFSLKCGMLYVMVSTDLATAKPIYDFSCKFMCQEVKDLAKGQEDFFNHFLPDEA